MPPEFHLPEPVLGMDVPLRKEQIALVAGVDVGHPILVAHNLYFRLQTLQRDRPGGIREWPAHGDHQRHAEGNQDQHQQEKQNDDNAGYTAHATSLFRR